ncbi:hypothetical protein F4776DRAFT_338383 [Hypoxylon sp. NC0597]|nr:hypothetical protein F4776DRAFT_338383 [Hypoxylon sp. NC0597]
MLLWKLTLATLLSPGYHTSHSNLSASIPYEECSNTVICERDGTQRTVQGFLVTAPGPYLAWQRLQLLMQASQLIPSARVSSLRHVCTWSFHVDHVREVAKNVCSSGSSAILDYAKCPALHPVHLLPDSTSSRSATWRHHPAMVTSHGSSHPLREAVASGYALPPRYY